MPAQTRPHISTALQHLRLSVTGTGAALCLALMAQVVVWACVHFLDLRTQKLGPGPNDIGELTVISAPLNEPAPRPIETRPSAGKSLLGNEPRAERPPQSRSEARAAAPEPVRAADVNTVASPADLTLRRVAGLAQAVGVLASLLLALLMFQGVIIAAGAQAPGVQYAVTAGVWSMIIALLCVPMSSLIPSATFPGVFCSYAQLTRLVDAYRTPTGDSLSAPAYFGVFLALPGLLTLGTLATILRFRAGVEEGVIITNVSQLDEKIESEIRRNKWGALAKPRAVGALNRAIGDRPEMPPAGTVAGGLHPSLRRAAGAESLSPPDDPDQPPGMPLRRPI